MSFGYYRKFEYLVKELAPVVMRHARIAKNRDYFDATVVASEDRIKKQIVDWINTPHIDFAHVDPRFIAYKGSCCSPREEMSGLPDDARDQFAELLRATQFRQVWRRLRRIIWTVCNEPGRKAIVAEIPGDITIAHAKEIQKAIATSVAVQKQSLSPPPESSACCFWLRWLFCSTCCSSNAKVAPEPVVGLDWDPDADEERYTGIDPTAAAKEDAREFGVAEALPTPDDDGAGVGLALTIA